MRIIDYNNELYKKAKAVLVHESDDDWTQSLPQKVSDDHCRILYHSFAPGSGAPSSVLAGAIQATYNLGFEVDKAEELFFEAIADKDNLALLYGNLSKIFYELNNAEVNKSSQYWNFYIYEEYQQYINQIKRQYIKYDRYNNEDIKDKIYWGWVGQIVAGSFGTALEGYGRESITKAFGEVTSYLKKPSTYNDDITFELALLEAYKENGASTKSKDIANKWAALIPFAWSAEDIALKNLRLGIYPPNSGKQNNPYREWIGAQMRGSICGMIAPNNPELAAKIAWQDGEISHYNNGILGEVFSAVLTSLAFSITNVDELLKVAMSYIPVNSLYYKVVSDTYEKCRTLNDEDKVIDYIYKEYSNYNLVHALPNAAIEVMTLYFSKGDFNQGMRIVAKAGLDVDCNAGQIGNILGVINYKTGLDKKWTNPINDELKTYVRTMEIIKLSDLVQTTYDVYRGLLG